MSVVKEDKEFGNPEDLRAEESEIELRANFTCLLNYLFRS